MSWPYSSPFNIERNSSWVRRSVGLSNCRQRLFITGPGILFLCTRSSPCLEITRSTHMADSPFSSGFLLSARTSIVLHLHRCFRQFSYKSQLIRGSFSQGLVESVTGIDQAKMGEDLG